MDFGQNTDFFELLRSISNSLSFSFIDKYKYIMSILLILFQQYIIYIFDHIGCLPFYRVFITCNYMVWFVLDRHTSIFILAMINYAIVRYKITHLLLCVYRIIIITIIIIIIIIINYNIFSIFWEFIINIKK